MLKKIIDGIFLRIKKLYNDNNSISSDNIKINKNLILPFTKANLQNLLTTYTVSFILKQNTDLFIASLKNIKALEHRWNILENIKIFLF